MYSPKSAILQAFAAKQGIPCVDLPMAAPVPFSLVAGLPVQQEKEDQ
jgi:hypothetical protein